MKKLMNIMKFIIIAILMLCISLPTVYAVETTNFSALLTANKQTVKRGETIEVIVAVGKFGDIGKGINTFKGKLEYDTKKLSIKSGDVIAQNGWDTPTFENNILLTTKGSMISSKEELIKIIFTVNDDAEIGKTIISLKNVEAANDENDFVGEAGNVSIEITEKNVVDDESGDKVDGDKVDDDKVNGDSQIGTDDKEPNTEKPDDNEAGNVGKTDNEKADNNNKDEQPTTEGTTVVVGGENKDNTTANKEIPKAGLDTMLIVGIVIIAIVAIIMYRKNRKYDDIK